jgi:hypothetical protein
MQTMSNIALGGGVPSSDLSGLVNHYFDTVTISTIQSAIDNGHPVMATLITSPTNGHEVMVTGYYNDGKIEYFDPEQGGSIIKQMQRIFIL